jgi:hypothetical protein
MKYRLNKNAAKYTEHLTTLAKSKAVKQLLKGETVELRENELEALTYLIGFHGDNALEVVS